MRNVATQVSSCRNGRASMARKIAEGYVTLPQMNRPLLLRSPRAVSPPNPSWRHGDWVPDSGASTFAAMMVWILIVYLVVPVGYFTGEMTGGNDTGMAGPNPLLRAF